MESRSTLRRGCQPENRKICVAVIVLAVIIGIFLLAYTAFGDEPRDATLKKVFIVGISQIFNNCKLLLKSIAELKIW